MNVHSSLNISERKNNEMKNTKSIEEGEQIAAICQDVHSKFFFLITY